MVVPKVSIKNIYGYAYAQAKSLIYSFVLSFKVADSNKPPEVVEKIINGRMQKFYSEVCLVEQEHMVEEGNPKVSKALKDHGFVVKSFQMFSI